MLVCQGTVVKVLKEENTYVTVKIKWDRECLREGDSETSWDKLMRSKQNSNDHEQGTWLVAIKIPPSEIASCPFLAQKYFWLKKMHSTLPPMLPHQPNLG
jgi:hypothetical protein